MTLKIGENVLHNMCPQKIEEIFSRLMETLEPIGYLIDKNIEKQKVSISAEEVLRILVASSIANTGVTSILKILEERGNRPTRIINK